MCPIMQISRLRQVSIYQMHRSIKCHRDLPVPRVRNSLVYSLKYTEILKRLVYVLIK